MKNNNYPLFLLPFFLIGLILSSNAWAAKLFVTENLRLRTEPSLESAILATVKKGGEVEVLGIQDDFTRIESENGTKGWVASSFLSSEKPEIPVVSAKPSKLVQANATIKKQSKQLKELKARLNKQEKTIKQLQTQLKLPKENKREEVSRVLERNSDSEEKIAQIREILGPVPTVENVPKKTIATELNSLSGLHYSIAGGVLLLGFILGLLWGDFIQRRRHGGYRV